MQYVNLSTAIVHNVSINKMCLNLCIDKYWREKVKLEIKDLDNANYYYNFLATTTTIFIFSTTPALSFICLRKIILFYLLIFKILEFDCD